MARVYYLQMIQTIINNGELKNTCGAQSRGLLSPTEAGKLLFSVGDKINHLRRVP